MKKVILTGATLLAFVATSFAQNTATLNQNGNYQTGVQQQTGSNQTSVITQTKGTGINTGNFAGTYQTSNVANTATVSQKDGSQGNRAGIAQNGGTSNATINQNGGSLGTSGAATAAQVANVNFPAGDGNLAGVAQTGTGNTGVVIDQNNKSLRNSSEIWQNGNNNVNTTTSQSGNSTGNFAEVLQGYSSRTVAGPVSTGSKATVEQNGGDAGHSSDHNQSRVMQSGVGQQAKTQQNASTAAWSQYNQTQVTQQGSGQKATTEQNAGSITTSNSNQATVDQRDADNTATVQQNA